MIAIEDADLERIVELVHDSGEYTGRLSVRGGLLIPGLLRASPYRIIQYGFVLAEEMPNISQFGIPEQPSFRLYEVRTIAAFVKALRLSRDWQPEESEESTPAEIPVPRIDEAREILVSAGIPVNGL